jgi:pyruvate,orthophosphate dikinase
VSPSITTPRPFTIDGKTYKEGDFLSIDGTSGLVYAGQIKTAPSEIITGLLNDDKPPRRRPRSSRTTCSSWAGARRPPAMSVRTNADTPEQTAQAIAFGAEGIGLTRTEHMFFEGDRIDAMREMILADSLEAREAALAKLLPYQRDDFFGIFKALKGYPATIRFLDPPLHEFLPHSKEQQMDLARKLGIPSRRSWPASMSSTSSTRCSASAAAASASSIPRSPACRPAPSSRPPPTRTKEGFKAKPEIMIPLVGFKKELDLQVAIVHEVAAQVQKEKKVKIAYSVGTMIEIPRGALTADEIAQTAEFFSFGTNDLTQTCLGMSRDDSGSFLGAYTENEIVKKNPFASIDQTGVGQLVQIAAEKGNKTRPGIKLGICGEHGGDPDSVKFCHRVGLTYVSCSPYRVPVARLAAAQAKPPSRKKRNSVEP